MSSLKQTIEHLNQNIFSTRNDWAGLIMRVTLGVVLFAHGAQKLFGWFNGYGFDGTMQFFTETVQLPWIVGFLVIIIESFGALFLVLGLGSRIMAIAIFGVMTGVLFTSHIQNGFYMNWYGTAAGEGIEFDLLTLGLAAAIVFNGAGKFSFDSIIHKKIVEGSAERKVDIRLRERKFDLG
ncbi:MAG TPA: DoxX family protein [Chitinophagaceae bacterium]